MEKIGDRGYVGIHARQRIGDAASRIVRCGRCLVDDDCAIAKSDEIGKRPAYINANAFHGILTLPRP